MSRIANDFQRGSCSAQGHVKSFYLPFFASFPKFAFHFRKFFVYDDRCQVSVVWKEIIQGWVRWSNEQKKERKALLNFVPDPDVVTSCKMLPIDTEHNVKFTWEKPTPLETFSVFFRSNKKQLQTQQCNILNPQNHIAPHGILFSKVRYANLYWQSFFSSTVRWFG